MVSVVGRMHRPVVRVIGHRLAAATTPGGMRRVVDRATLLLVPPRGVRVEPASLAGLDGLRVVPTVPASPPHAVLLLHGGGYVFGSPRTYRHLAGRIAVAGSAVVHLPSYRLAPEHPHPAAVEDGLRCYEAMLERWQPHELVVAGDSAGAGLAVAVLQAARDAALPMPAGVVLLSPWLDLTGTAPSHRTNADSELLILPPTVARAAGWYRGEHAADDPGVSPLFGDLDRLPPALVQVSDDELLLSDSLAFAERARAAGVEVVLEVESGMWHVWHLMAPAVPEARSAIERIGGFVVARTGG